MQGSAQQVEPADKRDDGYGDEYDHDSADKREATPAAQLSNFQFRGLDLGRGITSQSGLGFLLKPRLNGLRLILPKNSLIT